MPARSACSALLITLALLPAACGNDAEPDPASAPLIDPSIGNDLAPRQMLALDTIRGIGHQLDHRIPSLGRDDEWLMLAPPDHQLARLESAPHERVIAWQTDGQPLHAQHPPFDWTAVDTRTTYAQPGDHLLVLPANTPRPQGYIINRQQVESQQARVRAILRDAVQRDLTLTQAQSILEAIEFLHAIDDPLVLDWLETLARGQVQLTHLEHRDAGTEDGQLFGRRLIQLTPTPLSADDRHIHLIRGRAALALIPASGYQRIQPLRDLLDEPDAGAYATRFIRHHQPLTEPLAQTLVNLMVDRLDASSEDDDDLVRVQVTPLLDAIGGHDWEDLMTAQQRDDAERRQQHRGGERHHLDRAVDLAIATFEHPSDNVQQTGIRMVQRWHEFGWPVHQPGRIRNLAQQMPEHTRDRLLNILAQWG